MEASAPTTESDAGSNQPRELHLATWSRRFWAWLLDAIVVSVTVGVLGELGAPVPEVDAVTVFSGTSGIALFVYWTVLEGATGQSLGKMALDLRVTDRRGEPIGYGTAAIESFGKAFLLPLDCLVGWLAMEGEKLRLFNRVSNTIVIQTEREQPEGVSYVVPEE